MSDKIARIKKSEMRRTMIKIMMSDLLNKLSIVKECAIFANDIMVAVFTKFWVLLLPLVGYGLSAYEPDRFGLLSCVYTLLVSALVGFTAFLLNLMESRIRAIGSTYKQDLEIRTKALMREAGSITLIDHRPEELNGVLTVLPNDDFGHIEMCDEDSVEQMAQLLSSNNPFGLEMTTSLHHEEFLKLKKGDYVELRNGYFEGKSDVAIVEDTSRLIGLITLHDKSKKIDLLSNEIKSLLQSGLNMQMRHFLKDVRIQYDGDTTILPLCLITIGSTVDINDEGQVRMGGGPDISIRLSRDEFRTHDPDGKLLDALMNLADIVVGNIEYECHCECHYDPSIDCGNCCSDEDVDVDRRVVGEIGLRPVERNHVLGDLIYKDIVHNAFGRFYMLSWKHSKLPPTGTYRRYKDHETPRKGDEVIARIAEPEQEYGMTAMKTNNRIFRVHSAVDDEDDQFRIEIEAEGGRIISRSGHKRHLMKKIH